MRIALIDKTMQATKRNALKSYDPLGDDVPAASSAEDLSAGPGRLGAGFAAITGEASVRALSVCAEASIELMYCGGLLHRLPRTDGESLVAACFRVLKPLGTLRIATLDLDQIVHGYLFDWAGADDAGVSRTQRLNAAFREEGLQFLFGEEELTSLLARIGFVDIRRFGLGASAEERFWNLEPDYTQALILEARKP